MLTCSLRYPRSLCLLPWSLWCRRVSSSSQQSEAQSSCQQPFPSPLRCLPLHSSESGSPPPLAQHSAVSQSVSTSFASAWLSVPLPCRHACAKPAHTVPQNLEFFSIFSQIVPRALFNLALKGFVHLRLFSPEFGFSKSLISTFSPIWAKTHQPSHDYTSQFRYLESDSL